MGTKQKLLLLLEQKRGGVVSGEEVAAALGVSRTAVWKAVEALRKEGLAVESAPGSGYRLVPGSDLLTQDTVQLYMHPGAPPVRVLEEASSTNIVAKQWAMEGAPHGALVVAVRQNAGRGRRGRGFVSPPGGLYMSVVLRPEHTRGNPVLITAATAVAGCRAVQALCGLELGIKWVNDLFYNGKKCSGILTEGSTGFETGRIEHMVVGIGINYYTREEDFALEVRDVATSLFPHGTAPVPRAALAAEVHRRILEGFATLPEKEFLPEYRRRSIVLGQRVTVADEPPYEATALEIDEEARLVVQDDEGRRIVLAAGEISIKV